MYPPEPPQDVLSESQLAFTACAAVVEAYKRTSDRPEPPLDRGLAAGVDKRWIVRRAGDMALSLPEMVLCSCGDFRYICNLFRAN